MFHLVLLHFLLAGHVIGNGVNGSGFNTTSSTSIGPTTTYLLVNGTNGTTGNFTNSTFVNGSISNYTTVINNAANFTGNLTSVTQNAIASTPVTFLGTIRAILTFQPGAFETLIDHYGYAALFSITFFEGASAPIPSEVVIPTAGALSKTGHMNLFIAFFSMILGGILGTAVDFFIAWKLGREGVYKYAEMLHVKKSDLDAFDAWFKENGAFVVFTSRLLPVVRSAMNFPAGFSRMSPVKFFAYSLAGIIIWDAILFTFGYYLLASSNTTLIGVGIGGFVIVIYLLHKKVSKGFHHTAPSAVARG